MKSDIATLVTDSIQIIMFKIKYGNIDPFEGLAPTPFVERSVSSIFYAKKHGETESFVLNGMITGDSCVDGNEFSEMWSRANQLIDNFSKPFQRFEIVEDLGLASGRPYSNGHAIIRSIDFEDSVYAGVLPFSVSLDVFREGSFSNYGVLEPSQNVSFEQTDNGNVNISKVTSAVGFNTENPAIENAIEFVKNITGVNSLISPAFISSSGVEGAILTSLNEKIDRLQGSYEVSEGWIYNIYGDYGDHSIHEKTVSIDSGENGITVSVAGKINGGIKSSISDLRDDFSGIDFFGMADEAYSGYGSGSLFVKPLSRQISENATQRSIDFSFVYSDTIKDDPYFVDSISVQIDELTNKTCISSNISIRSTDSCPTSRWNKVKAFSDTFDITDWMKNRMDELGYNLTFPNKVKSSSISFNKQDGVISQSASMCDKKIIIPEHFDDFNYTVSVTPSALTYVPFQGLDSEGSFTVQKLIGLTRKAVSIQGEGQISKCSTYEQAKSSLLSYINNAKLLYLEEADAFLTQHNVQRGGGESRKQVSFSFGWNEESSLVFPENLIDSSFIPDNAITDESGSLIKDELFNPIVFY